jgi:hypothetical protein
VANVRYNILCVVGGHYDKGGMLGGLPGWIVRQALGLPLVEREPEMQRVDVKEDRYSRLDLSSAVVGQSAISGSMHEHVIVRSHYSVQVHHISFLASLCPRRLVNALPPLTSRTATKSIALKIAMMKNGAPGVQLSKSAPPSFVSNKIPAPPARL